MGRQDIEFGADGVTLRGWFYPGASGASAGAGAAGATVVLAHGFSAVKEMRLDAFAAVFAAAGLNAVVFDHRGFGASDGEPRQEIDPWAQVRDYRHAITYAATRPEAGPGRIGVWGTSYSGGHALVVAAIDRRVRAVVAQVPLVSGSANRRAQSRPDQIAAARARFDADRLARFRGEPPAMIPVVAPGMAPCALRSPGAYEWFSGQAAAGAPSWRNEITLRSAEMTSEYEPASYIAAVSPTPLLLLPAREDYLCPAELAIAAFGQAREPKELVVLPGGHFGPYAEHFGAASGLAAEWFTRHLAG